MKGTRTRYSRRIGEDTFEHFDSQEAYDETITREKREGVKATIAFLGFLYGGFLSFSFLHYSSWGADHWPKLIRLLIVLVTASTCSYVAGRFAERIVSFLQITFGLAILFGIASLIWRVV